MAVIKYLNQYRGPDIATPDYELLVFEENHAEVSFSPNETYVLRGEDFQYEDGKIIGGTLLGGKLMANGVDIVRVNDISWDISSAVRYLYQSPENDRITGSPFADDLRGFGGNDTIKGWKGDDQIIGMAGRDVLVGNKGSDHFAFRPGHGRDEILDFDANGGGRRQDYIEFVERTKIDFHRSGDDVVLTYGEGDKVILRDVDIGDFSRSDIIWP